MSFFNFEPRGKKKRFNFDFNVLMALDVKSVSVLKLHQFNANSLIKGTDINIIITRRAMPQTKKKGEEETLMQHNSQMGWNEW